MQKYSGWDVNTMVAISQAESNTDVNGNGVFDPEERCYAKAKGDTTLTYQQNDRTYGYSLSVLQVRILPGREHCDTFDVATIVKCAYDIYGGQGYSAWSVYTNGKYRQYL